MEPITYRNLQTSFSKVQFILDFVMRLFLTYHSVDCHSEHAEKYGFNVVERFVGHGVGTVFHSEPIILHHRKWHVSFDILHNVICMPVTVMQSGRIEIAKMLNFGEQRKALTNKKN